MSAVDTTTGEVLTPLTESEARTLTNLIKASTKELWDLLLEAHQRKAWKALGYESWRAYAKAEFEMSETHAYQILDQGRVIRAIEEVAGVSAMAETDITERMARDIKPILPEVVDDIGKRIERGQEPEEAVRDTVAVARSAAKAHAPVRRLPQRPATKVLESAVANLRAVAQTLESLSADEFDDDVPADEWVKEIDHTLKALRGLRQALRRRYALT